ncbi:exported hypothetical protein [Capnocytophaga canimorsus]|uniref:Uncharacterized protein n=1 Tax=Capnocytophaga canimorsus TaxID=28188 RepID=A0A0B7ILZ4_9FLAO|nr:exported hypothetical protein [Capnocytophaga canimorsus]CEN52875.1 exported hypothetical protein [Capnocytophaga canimorsus]
MSIVGVFLCTANSVLANNTGYQTLLGNTTIGIVMDFGELGAIAFLIFI